MEVGSSVAAGSVDTDDTGIAAVEKVKSPEEELLDLLARQGRRVPYPVLAVLSVVAWLAYAHTEVYKLAIWLAAVVVVLIVRYVVLGRLPEMHERSLDERINIAVLLSAINGIAHGASLYFFPLLTEVERAIQSMMLAGLSTAAVATTAGYRRIFVAYLIPIYAPLTVLWATNGSWSTPTPANATLAATIALFAGVLMMLARDTERQFFETIRIRKEQEALNEQLQEALQAAGVADRAKTRFLAAASHDLRQPIHALSLFGASLRMQNLPDNVRELANNIDESISVLASQLDALLDISRLDAGVVKPELGVIDLTAMLRRVGREFEPEAHDKGLSVTLELEENCQVRSDKLLLERVIRNLLNNALRYTEHGGITLRTTVAGDQCIVEIADTGIGIAEGEQSKIFSEFYQVSREATETRQGLGLGLSIVTRLLGLLGTPLELESTPGEGTSIKITLPLEQTEKEDQEVGETTRLSGLHVLVIDDDRAVRTAMSALLDNFGARTTAAEDVDEALAMAQAERPDIVLSDLRLENATGIDAICRIRELYGDLPAILITGDTSPEQIHKAQETGLDILHKPVNAAELERSIAAALAPVG